MHEMLHGVGGERALRVCAQHPCGQRDSEQQAIQYMNERQACMCGYIYIDYTYT